MRLRPAASATRRPIRGRAGEDQVVERERGKSLGDLILDAGDDHFGRVEFRRDHLFQQRREPRRQLARLDHHPVAGGERPDRRRQRELERIIPGRDDADDAERLRDQVVFRRPELQRGRNAPRRHPCLQVLGGVLDLREQKQRFGDRGLDCRAVAEIGQDRLLEACLVLGDRRAQPLQQVQTLIQRRGWLRDRERSNMAWKASSRALCPGLFSDWSMAFPR